MNVRRTGNCLSASIMKDWGVCLCLFCLLGFKFILYNDIVLKCYSKVGFLEQSHSVFCNLKSVHFFASEIRKNVDFFSLVILIQASGSGQSQIPFLVLSHPSQ